VSVAYEMLCGHSIAPVEEVMKILHVTKKGNMMNALQKFHIKTIKRLDK